jgi:hypothetical protein
LFLILREDGALLLDVEDRSLIVEFADESKADGRAEERPLPT